MTIVRKDATITNTGKDDDFPGTFEVVLSAPTKDRDGDTLLPDDWKLPLPDHITFDQDHLMSVAGTVGSGVPRIDEKTGSLIVSGTYSSLDRAQDVRTLVNEGHIRTTSVAFMTEKTQKDGATVTKRELLNGAFVAIPSNREAVVLSSKGFVRKDAYSPEPYDSTNESGPHVTCPECGKLDATDAKYCDQCGFKLEGADGVQVSKGFKAGARNSAADAEMIQGIHDHAATLGADCTVAKSFRRGQRAAAKSIAGSLEAAQDRARDALQDANAGVWCWLRGTVPDGNGGGYLVFELEDPETYDCDTYKQSYRDDGSVVTLMGDAVPVDVMEIVTADPDEDASGASGSGQAPAAGAPMAPAAGVRSAPVVDGPSAEISARAARLRLLNTSFEV